MPGFGRGRGRGVRPSGIDEEAIKEELASLKIEKPERSGVSNPAYEDPIEHSGELKIDESTSDIQDSPTKSEGGEVDDAGERATEEFDIVSTSTEESEKEERRRFLLEQKSIRMLKPEMVKATHEDDIVYKRKKITLRSNYFNISLKMKALYMYRVEWGTNDRFAPIFKTKEEREAAFMDFCGQYINRDPNVSGFDQTMIDRKSIPSYDGENAFFYHHKMEEMAVFKEFTRNSNWNEAIKGLIEKSEAYTNTKNIPTMAETWLMEKKKKNQSMFPNKGKKRVFLALEVNHRPKTARTTHQYMLLITRVKTIYAQELEDCASGKMHSQVALQAIDCIFRAASISKDYTRIKRTLYSSDPSYKIDANCGKGKFIWLGTHQTVRPTKWKSFALNIDQHAAMFFDQQPCADLLGELVGERGMASSKAWKGASLEMKGLEFTTNYGTNSTIHKISGLSEKSARESFFTKDGKNVSVADYFVSLGQKLDHPDLPCLKSGKGSRAVLFPIEKCNLLGNQIVKGANPSDVQALIKEAAKAPEEMQKRVGKLAKSLKKEMKDFLEDYGLDLDVSKMAKTNAEVITAPKVDVSKEEKVQPSQGNVRDFKKVKKAGKEIKFFIVAKIGNFGKYGPRKQNLQNFKEGLKKKAKEMGISIKNDLNEEHFNGDIVDISDHDEGFFEQCQGSDVDLAIIILPDTGGSEDYAWVKRWAELKFGIMTQCIKNKNFCGRGGKGIDPMTAGNLLMKINHKMNGINMRVTKKDLIHIFQKPVMVIGTSLSHSASGGPTVATISASIDSAGAQYVGFATLQSKGHNVQELDVLVKKCLEAFYKATKGAKPHAIIYYKDGLGEGQFEDCLKYEVGLIRKACREMPEKYGDYNASVTMISVQRSHHTKFYVDNQGDGEGKAKNIPAGTVVESGPTSSIFYDFYLCSHAGIQGTSKAAHYMVMHDENNLSARSLQNMTYALCHCYARCTRTVSTPVAVCYAKLLTDRARYWLKTLGFSESGSVSSGGSTKDEADAKKKIGKVAKALSHRMFFT